MDPLPGRSSNGVFVSNQTIYLKIEELEKTVLSGLAQRPTWAALGRVIAVFIPIAALLVAWATL